jgi:hypothetical protein
MNKTTSIQIPGFLVGRAKSQWKSVLVRNTPVEQATVCVFTAEDIMGDLVTNTSTFALAA